MSTKYEVLTPTGFKDFKGIRKKNILDNLVCLIFDNDSHLNCTLNHRLQLPDSSFKAVCDLKVGDNVKSEKGSIQIVTIKPITNKSHDVFDLLDVGGHCYYTNSVVSHNCEFVGSTSTLIQSQTLNSLSWEYPLAEIETYQGIFLKYENPKADHLYVCIVDVAEGTGNDYSVVNVIDVMPNKYKQVALYKSNKIPPLLLSECVNFMAKTYNDAFVLIESNGAGMITLNDLRFNLEYDNLFLTTNNEIHSQGMNLGVKTDKKVKSQGCAQLKLLVESRLLEVVDHTTIEELNTFSRHKNSYAATEGAHDDIVMTLVLFAWLSTQEYFKEFSDINYKNVFSQDSYEFNLPLGFFNDGIN